MPQPSRLEVTSDKMSKCVSFPQKMFLLPFLRFPARNGSSSFPFFADGQLSGKGEDVGEGRAGDESGDQIISERFASIDI